ncbi:MAG: S8 family serine peptidase [Candidatus Zixiibacteriota bacterium]
MKSRFLRLSFFLIMFVALAGVVSAERISNSAEESASTRQTLIPRQIIEKPLSIAVSGSADIDHIVVKFKEGLRTRLTDGRIHTVENKQLISVNELLSAKSISSIRRLLPDNPATLERRQFVLEEKSRYQLADFNTYFIIDVSSPSEAEALVYELNALPEVEIAYIRPKSYPAVDIDPPTSSFVDSQVYLGEAPEGIDAYYAWTQTGGDGSGITIADIEGSWKFDHEDLEIPTEAVIGGDPNLPIEWRNHGSAVVGMLIAGDNGYGVTGIVHGADIALSSHNGSSDAGAVMTAADSLEAGDVILIEIQTPGPRYDFAYRTDQLGYVPIEYFQAEFDAIQYAWAKGIIVVEAAANGAENLSDAIYENRFDTTYRNSHAIFVGAGAPPSGTYGVDRKVLDFSNYGARVNLQGYGREVVTCGYGDLFNGGLDERQYYTRQFGGTSGAAPMIAGAVAALQGIYKNRFGTTINADRLRDVLVATGSPQQGFPTSHIGPRPDIEAADSALPEPFVLAPHPGYIDTTMAPGDVISIPVSIVNSSPSASIDFDISIPDSLLKNSQSTWLSVSSSGGTVLPSDSVSIDVTLDASVLDDRTTIYKGILEISFGESGGSLDELIYLPVFLDVPCADTMYAVSTSSDIGGPAFLWYDLTTVGLKIPAYSWYNDAVSEDTLDDGTAGPYTFGFDFPFYDTVYSSVYIGANGAVSFTETDINIEGLFNDINIPNPPFSTLVAPFWNDLTLEPDDGHGDVYFYRMPLKEGFIVEYHQVGNFNSADDTLTTFQVILYRNGNIKFQYLSTGTSGLADSAVIGIADYDCKSVSHVARGIPSENIVTDSSAILFDYAGIIWEMSGDINSDNSVNIGDAVFMISYIFKGGSAPQKLQEADTNCDGSANIGDAVYLISYIFKGGPAPCMYEL